MAEAVLAAPAIKPKDSRDDWTMRAVHRRHRPVPRHGRPRACRSTRCSPRACSDHGRRLRRACQLQRPTSPPPRSDTGPSPTASSGRDAHHPHHGGPSPSPSPTRSLPELHPASRGWFQAIAMIPILVPSLLPGIALVYLFGNSGAASRSLLFGHTIYGPDRHRDRGGVLHPPARGHHPRSPRSPSPTPVSVRGGGGASLRASRLQRSSSPSPCPAAATASVSAAFVVFTLAITDFGAPKVIGGDYNVLATDVYKQVIGQQNFRDGRGGERRPPDSGGARVLRSTASCSAARSPCSRPARGAAWSRSRTARVSTAVDARLLQPGQRVPRSECSQPASTRRS